MPSIDSSTVKPVQNNELSRLNLSNLAGQNKVVQSLLLAEVNHKLENMSAIERIVWALDNLDGEFAVSSSFGNQASVMLHLLTEVKSDITVILTDTGYLFPETYLYIDALTEKLNLNLKVYRAKQSPNWQEARYGKLWENGIEGIEQYNRINKVEPMRRALKDLNVATWFSGLRRGQSTSRQNLPILAIQNGVYKFLPIIDWEQRDIDSYIEENKLPRHPLEGQGYLSIGDTHTTEKFQEGMKEEETRFFGLKRECGLHEDDAKHQDGSGI